MDEFKKTVIKELCRMIINVITAAMVALGISSCTGWQGECSGSFCVKKKADTQLIEQSGTVIGV